MADTLESTGQYLPKDLRITLQPDAVDKNKFTVVATPLKIGESYVFQFRYVFEDGSTSEWGPGYVVLTNTETVPSAPTGVTVTGDVGLIKVALSSFPTNAKRVDIYVSGGAFGIGNKVVESFTSAGIKTIVATAGVYNVSLFTVTPSNINGDPTGVYTVTVTGQQQVIETPTLPSGLSVASAPYAVSINWNGTYSGSTFQGFKSIDIHARDSDVGATATTGFSTTTQVATLTVNSTTNRQNVGLDNLRQALGLASNTLAYTSPIYFYYISRNENDSLYSVSGTPTYTRINSTSVNPSKGNYVDLANGVISIENLVAGNGQFSSWLRTGSVGGARIELSGTNDFTPTGESIVVKKGITAYSSGSTEIFRLDIGTTPKLTIKGDGEFTGDLSIGSGSNIFKAKPAEGIWLGHASSLASAPFSVTNTGILTAQSGLIGGWTIDGSQLKSTANNNGQIALYPNTGNGGKIALILSGTEKITIDPVEGIVGPTVTKAGNTGPAFKIDTAGNAQFRGDIYADSGIFSGTLRTGTSGSYIEITSARANEITFYSSGGSATYPGVIYSDTSNGAGLFIRSPRINGGSASGYINIYQSNDGSTNAMILQPGSRSSGSYLAVGAPTYAVDMYVGAVSSGSRLTVRGDTVISNILKSSAAYVTTGLDETNLNAYGLLDPDGGSNWQGGVIRNIKSQTTTVTHNQSASGFIEGTILLVRRA